MTPVAVTTPVTVTTQDATPIATPVSVTTPIATRVSVTTPATIPTPATLTIGTARTIVRAASVLPSLAPSLVPFLALALALGASTKALAKDNDFRLNATREDREGVLFQTTTDGRFEPRDEEWRSLVTELGYVFSPRLSTPAETLGHAGFSLGIAWTGTKVSGSEPFWLVTERGQRTRSAAGLLHTLQLDARKGLPFSFEVGANMMWLVDSRLVAPGLEVRWALQEGYAYAPDFAVRGSVNHMVGSRDLMLTTVGLDLSLSKGFGVLSMVHVAPYVTWSFLFIAATSRVIDPTPTIDSDPEKSFVFRSVRPGAKLHHKLTLGVRASYSVLSVTVQGEAQVLEDRKAIGPVGGVTTKLGLEF